MKKFLITISFGIAYCVGFGLTYHDGPSDNRSSFLWLGLLLGTLAIVTFFYAGSRHILFASVLSYGHLVFVAAPAVSIGLGRDLLRSDLRSSVSLMYLSFFFLIQIAVFVSSESLPKFTVRNTVVEERFQILAMMLAAGGFVAHFLGRAFFAFEIMALAGIILSSLVTFTRPTPARMIPHIVCLVVITTVYAVYVFGGYGRLLMASLLFSIAVVYSWIHRSYSAKLVTITATVPGFAVLTLRRIAAVEESYGKHMEVSDGLISVFGPFQSGAYILQQVWDGVIAPTHGESHLTSLLFWIPRAIWVDKPPGFGRAIVPVTQPYMMYNPEHSDAASYLAEFFWDFGMMGLLLVPVLIVIVIRADRWIKREILTTDWTKPRRNRAFLAASLVAFVGMFQNYVWGGSFTYLTRSLIPALILFGLFVLSDKSSRRMTKEPLQVLSTLLSQTFPSHTTDKGKYPVGHMAACDRHRRHARS